MQLGALVFAVTALFALASSAAAQSNSPTGAPGGPQAESTSGSSPTGPVYRVIELRGLIDGLPLIDKGDAERDIPPPAPKVVTRKVPLPPARPQVFGGRPVSLDAQFDPQSLVLVFEADDSEAFDTLIDAGMKQRFGLVLLGSRTFGLGGKVVALYQLPEGQSVLDMIERVRKVPGVIGVQPQYLFFGSADQSSAGDMRALQYAPAKLNALSARQTGEGKGVVVGLIDTGLDRSQPELADADIRVFDVLDGTPTNDMAHGTALAGLMLASRDMDGISPGASLVSVRAFDADEDGQAISGSFEVAVAIDIAIEHGVRLLNLSFAGPRDPLVMSVLDQAARNGAIIVAAAGNGGPSAAPAWPGAHRDAIAVTATDAQDVIFSGANRGDYIAVAAPGVDVLSPVPGGAVDLLSGTSIATAHVSAIVALMLEQRPDLTAAEVMAALVASSHDLGEPGRDSDFGAGLADAAAALRLIAR